MNSLKLFKNYLIKPLTNLKTRPISLSANLKVKEIKEVENGKELVIYGEIKQSDRVPKLIINPHQDKCPICASGLDIKHTDVLILSQFLRTDGCLLPKRITGLCRTQQRRVSKLVAMAQKAGLMPTLGPARSKKDPKKRYQWKKFNTYFDEDTIKY